MINSNIKVDLHIHSKCSEYKEEKDVVENSTFDNISILLDQLLSKEINLFSFTDHNRFDENLYRDTINFIKSSEKYKNKISILPGVEFDVMIDDGLVPSHFLTYFNVKNESYLSQITKVINENLLIGKDDYYTIEKYENLLKKIGLSVIIIVCQRKNLDNHNGKNNSLSDTTMTPYTILKYGYINALEYKSITNEGVLKKNLVDNSLGQALVCGSDCHDWSTYPFHDSRMKKEYEEKKIVDQYQYCSEIKALPTFLGLLMALTSPETRFNRSCNDRDDYIKKLYCNDKEYVLTSGINVIIGENGSGKSTLLKILNNENKETYVKKIKKDNSISFDKYLNPIKSTYISQSKLVDSYVSSGNLLGDDKSLFKEIDNTKYINEFNKYSDYLLKQVNHNIRLENYKQEILADCCVTYDKKKENIKNHFIDLSYDKSITDSTNEFYNKYNNIVSIIQSIKSLYHKYDFSIEEKNKIQNAFYEMVDVLKSVFKNYIRIEYNKKIKNYIKNCIDSYSNSIATRKTTAEKDRKNYIDNKNKVTNSLLNYYRELNNGIEKVGFPSNIDGISNNSQKGFIFQKIAKYHKKDLKEEFFKQVFVSDFSEENKVLSIRTDDAFIKSLRGLTNGKHDDYYKKISNKFLEDAISTTEVIQDESTNIKIGGTLGEQSLLYYRYLTYENYNYAVFAIDQPEDNISNYRIKNDLLTFFNKLRENSQIIIVTHNPLLVVNLDADNVFCLENDKGNISIRSGCLEDEENGMIGYIEKHMDGGKEELLRRLKFYAENN